MTDADQKHKSEEANEDLDLNDRESDRDGAEQKNRSNARGKGSGGKVEEAGKQLEMK